ncbi:MAG: prolyl aminopeptidase [Nitrospira sp.]|nr:prolyl aminopeptidase [Nitrospira sp.]
MRKLYPDIQPYATQRLAVDSLHVLHVEECGNPEGVPVLLVHGGPGAGIEPYHRRFLDPNVYRMVLFDQRGAGRSTPHASLESNTTQHLLADLELLREHLGINRWLLLGGSWGSALSLLYAEAHPQRVLGLILRGVFLCRPREIRWFYQDGAGRVFPEYWQEFVAPIPEEERHDLLAAHYRRLIGDDEVARMACAKAWSLWQGRAATLGRNTHVMEFFASPHTAVALARMGAHYFINSAFLGSNQILRDAHRLRGMPGVIVHGRYDMICPLESAFDLQRAWPDARLEIIPEAGHSASEPGIVNALVLAGIEMAERVTRATS